MARSAKPQQWRISICLGRGVTVTPIEVMAVMMLAMALGLGVHAHSESEQEVFYCLMCAGMSNKQEIKAEADNDL